MSAKSTPAPPDEVEASYLLQTLGLFNWGPFHGRHEVEIDRRGTAIIGATGSGKTTLVDALMTLLCERPRYNLASTGGHESDRDWISYVRGKSGEGNDLDDSHIARPGKTVSAIAASFGNAAQQVALAGIFWLDSSSSAQSDLKRVWSFAQGENQSMDELLEHFQQGGYRGLKNFEKQADALIITKSKRAYLAKVQRFFGVGENAFTLLNRAAGMKQINSIDLLFRELVLDDKSAFERAVEVVKGFDTLSHIREELLIARRQHESLLPIDKKHQRRTALVEQEQDQKRLRQLLPKGFAGQRLHLLEQRKRALMSDIEALEQQLAELDLACSQAQLEAESCHAAYLSKGGEDVKHLQRLLQHLRKNRERIALSVAQYQHLMKTLALDARLELPVFQANQQRAAEMAEGVQQALQARQQEVEAAIVQVAQIRQQQQELEQELAQVMARPGSNIPPRQDDFRQRLAQYLELSEGQLPFVAELLEVKPEQAQWRGAIERALGAERLRILVPEQHISAALRWVNQRDNLLDVRLLRVEAEVEQARFLSDGFVRKLNFKPHPHREALKRLLAKKDLHCVDSAQALRDTPYGMTREGMISGRRGYYEKRDSTELNRNWMTGFDNRDRLAQLRTQLAELQHELKPAQQQRQQADDHLHRVEAQATQLAALHELRFEQIDVSTVEAEINELESHLEQLLSPASDTEQARRRWEQARAHSEALNERRNQHKVDYGLAQRQLQALEQQRQRVSQALGQGLSEADGNWFLRRLPAPMSDDLEALDAQENRLLADIDTTLEDLGLKIRQLENQLVRLMEQAQKVDTGALSEVGTELQDIPEYCQRLDVLVREALPDKEARFVDYLNESSDQSVTQLLSGVANAVTEIEERIEELNETMYQVDFQPGRYLRLEATPVVHESTRTLSRAQKRLNAARLEDDQGESHYQALFKVVELVRAAAENRRKVGSRALLDPRYRLQFRASVVDRQAQRVINSFGGSQGGSGGEKEIITSYILTASLSYALCPPGAQRPVFGSIVLDEAFSKSSQSVAGRIVSALRQFGLHPLFVTPNKEMQLLRNHTRSAILIHRRGSRATTTRMSWQELHDKAQQVRQSRKS